MFPRRPLAYFTALAGSVIIYSLCWAAPAMVEKNLFSQDRKPPSPDTVAPSQSSKPGIPITNLQLDGIMIRGNIGKALIRLKSLASPGSTQKKGQSPFVTVRENQQVSDFRVVKIEPKSVTLEKDGQTYVLNLYTEGKVVVPAAVQQPAQGAGAPGVVQPGRQPGAVQTPQQQPGAPVQPGAPNMPDQGIIDPSLMQQLPQVVYNPGQVEPDAAVPDQVMPPEEFPPQQ